MAFCGACHNAHHRLGDRDATRKISPTKILGLNWKNHAEVWTSVALAIALFGITAVVLWKFGGQDTDLERILRSSRGAALTMAFMATVTAPLVEEVIYRGLLYSALQRMTGPILGVTIVTFMFAGLHVLQYWPNFGAIVRARAVSRCRVTSSTSSLTSITRSWWVSIFKTERVNSPGSFRDLIRNTFDGRVIVATEPPPRRCWRHVAWRLPVRKAIRWAAGADFEHPGFKFDRLVSTWMGSRRHLRSYPHCCQKISIALA